MTRKNRARRRTRRRRWITAEDVGIIMATIGLCLVYAIAAASFALNH